MKIEDMQEKLKPIKTAFVAEKTGVAESTIRAIVRGDNTNPTYENYIKIVEFLDGEEK